MIIKKSIKPLSSELRRLRWQCRRGMLELDVLLGDFFDRCYLDLPDVDQQAFVLLLKQPDQLLFGWLMANEKSSVPVSLQQIVAKLLFNSQ